MKVSLKQIAEITGVSRGTVDRAIHNRGGVNPRVRDEILSVAESLGYIPNLASRQLAAKKQHIKLGFILPEATDNSGFWADVHRGIDDAEEEFGNYNVTVLRRTFNKYTASEELDLIDKLLAENISGLAIVPLNDPAIRNRLFRLSESGLPIILVNSEMEDISHLCYVGADYRFSGRTAAGILGLLSKGQHIELMIFNGTRNMLSHTQRIIGFLQEVNELKLNCNLINVFRLYNESEESIFQSGYDEAMAALSAHPETTAVFTAAGSVTAVSKAIFDSDLSDSVTHIAFDLNTSTINALKKGGLSVVIGQESSKQGYLPVKTLFDCLVNKQSINDTRYIMKNEIYIKQNAILT